MISTAPKAGLKILRGGKIAATVSRGPERYPMPTVTGLTREAATAALSRHHLAVGSVDDRYNEKVAEGLVLDASADPGDQLKPDTRVDLTVSAGPRPIKITDFTGRPVDEAESALKKAGFAVSVETRHSRRVPEGSVIEQTPRNGTGHRGDKITLVRSLGPVMVTVPDVKRFGVEAARKALEDKGFTVKTTKSGVLYLGLGYVASSDPAGGSKAPKGSTVTLSLV